MENKEYLQTQNKKTKRRKTERRLSRTFMYLVIAVIWLHSMMPPSISARESGFLFAFLNPLLTAIFGGNATEFLLRKLGHFTEFFVLGFLVWHNINLNMKTRHMDKRYRFLLSVGCCAVVAFFDETIQIFSGRGPSIVDVWIDIGGAFCATVLYNFVMRFILKKPVK